MGKYKYEFLHFFERDYRTYEQHFQEMAKQGYFIESINGWIFKYRKDESQNLIYSFDYDERTHALDGNQSKDNMEYRNFIEESGWVHVLRLGKINLFSNKHLNASSLHSDDYMLYQSMNYEHPYSTFTLVLPLLIILLFVGITVYGWKAIILSNFKMIFCIGSIIFEFVAFIYLYTDNKSLKINEHMLKMGMVPEGRSYHEIKKASVLSFVERFKTLPVLIRLGNLEVLGVLILSIILFEVICAYILRNKHNYIFNGIIVISSIGLLLFLSTLPFVDGIDNTKYNTMSFLPNHIEIVDEYKHSSSIFFKRYDYLSQRDKEQYEEFGNSIDIQYYDCRYQFIADIISNKFIDDYNITQEHRILNDYDESYQTYYLNQGNVYIKYEVYLYRNGNQIVFITTGNKDLFDVEGIIEDCMSIE